jgi:hypothetical protein
VIAATPCCFLRAFVFTWQQGGRLQKNTALCSFLSSFEFQIFAARFRVMNPYKVAMSNLTLTLTCSALKVQLPRLLLIIKVCESALLFQPNRFPKCVFDLFIQLIAHRLKQPLLAFAIWAAATPVTCL